MEFCSIRGVKMRILNTIVVILLLFILASCEETSPYTRVEDIYFGEYELYYYEQGDCNEEQKIFVGRSLKNNVYLVGSGCSGSDYYILINDKYISVLDAIKNRQIRLFDILESGYGMIEFESALTEKPQCTGDVISSQMSTIGELNGYFIIRDLGWICFVEIGPIIIEGFDFGYHGAACHQDIDNIGYQAYKDGVYYELSELIEDDVFTIEDVYNLYICDEANSSKYIQ
jgi:hypothetical protein